MRKTKAARVTVILIVTILAIAAAYLCYKTFIETPKPIPVHAFYKRANWAWTENDVNLIKYGDDVQFQYKNIRYSLDSKDFIAWQVCGKSKQARGEKSKSFTITMPDETIIQDTCYEPVTPKNQTSCIIIDTGVMKYYVHPDRVEFR